MFSQRKIDERQAENNQYFRNLGYQQQAAYWRQRVYGRASSSSSESEEESPGAVDEMKQDVPAEGAVRQETLDGRLITAVSKGDLKIARKLIDGGADVNIKDKYQRPLLSIAAFLGDLAMADLLTIHHADMKSDNLEEDFRLYQATGGRGYCQKKFKQNLIGHPLFIAVKTNNLAIASLLLKAGSDPNYGHSLNSGANELIICHTFPLLTAIRNGSAPMVNLLLEFGGKISDTEMSTAFQGGSREILEIFLPKATEEQKAKFFTLWVLCKASKNKECLDLMIQHGADIKMRDKDGDAVMHKALEDGHCTLENLLLEGAEINARDKKGDTPLHIAARKYRSEEIINFLVEQGANPALKNNDGRTPYSLARHLQGKAYFEKHKYSDTVKALKKVSGESDCCTVS